MEIQVIKQNDKPEWAVVPYSQFIELVEKAETLKDLQDYHAVKAALERGEEELIPSEVVDALFEGRNRIKVWRDHRGLTQQETAEAAGISVPYLSQLESGKRKGSVKVMAALARALNLSLDLLIGPK